MTVGSVDRIYRYPVKSLGGESLESARVGARGIRGDRAWAIWDEAADALTGGKKLPELMSCRARYLDEPPESGSGTAEIELQGGVRVRTDASDAAARLSQALGRRLALRSLRPAEDVDFYRRRGAPGEDFEAYLRGVFARTEDEPLPDLAKFPPEVLQYETPPGTFFDAYPLLLLSERALATLRERAPDSRFDVRRFRPNLLVGRTEAGAGFPELAWLGKRLRIGGAVLSVAMECPRCVMTTHGFDDLPRDPGVMRALVREAGGNLGVYASVEEPGRISVGDRIELL